MPAGRSVSHVRWSIALLLCLASTLNYLDRQTLSVLAATIQRELGFTSVEYSWFTTAFLVTYTVMYAVSGRIVDHLGTRRSFMVFLTGWSLATMLHAPARTVLHFSAARALLGAFQPANFPAGVRAVSEWFPMHERALAVGIFNAGTAMGSAVATPVVAFVALAWGWRSAFIVSGALGFIWLAVWAWYYRLPHEHPSVSAEERMLIAGQADGGAAAAAARPPSIGAVLRMREAWGCILARVLTDPISYFLAFWTPKYLQDERGFSLADLGRYGWIPFVALAVGNIASGAVPRLLVARGWSVDRARKASMLGVSLAMPICCYLVTQVDNVGLAVALLAAIMFGHAAWGNITLPAEVFPREAVGTVSGFGGALGGLAGAITQLTIGWVVANLSFTPIFAVCSVMYLVALGFVQLLIGELGVIRRVPR
ncbi:MAG TPA: MFS transporter [Vicinamibacterales bacterium]